MPSPRQDLHKTLLLWILCAGSCGLGACGEDSPVEASHAEDASEDTTHTSPDVFTDSLDTSEFDAEDGADLEGLPDTTNPSDAADVLEIPDVPIVIRAHRLDDTLHMNHLQAIGTHNSYHVQPEGVTLPEWSYTHLPLDEQLESQGVRKLELDFYYNGRKGYFEIYHVFGLDDETTCLAFTDCLKVIKRWSDTHASHHPILVLLEPKLTIDSVKGVEHLAKLEAEILSVWPQERLVTPDFVQDRGAAADLRSAVESYGWPTLGEVRGRLMFVLHDTSGWRDTYLGPSGSTRGKLIFPEAGSDLEAPFAAYHSLNDPVGGLATIQAALAAGHLVRTRADTAGAAPVPPDYGPLQAALASGAHYISTDHPGLGDDTTYGASIPDGTPSRCNPVTAPTQCLATDIEDPALLSP